jgi:kynurenine formamidase
MTKVGLLTAALFIFVLSTLIAVTSETAQQDAASVEPPPVTKAQADRWMTELSNWGRWGKDDQLGALNLITPQKRKQAMALARTGTVVSLERPVALTPKPEESKADNKPHGISFYEIRFKTFPPGDPRGNDGFSSDIQEFHVHGGMTHLDALCHDSSDGRLYNGFPLTTVDENTGCTKLALDNVKEGLVTRGILIDMTRLKRRSPRQPGSRIYADDIEAWERQTGLRVSAGDALFAYNPQPGAPATGANGGFDLSVVPWLKARDGAVTSGVRPIADDRHADHRLVLVALGVYLLDGVELRPLAETAASLNRWEFMLVVAPLRVPGSTGSPVNPLAMF